MLNCNWGFFELIRHQLCDWCDGDEGDEWREAFEGGEAFALDANDGQVIFAELVGQPAERPTEHHHVSWWKTRGRVFAAARSCRNTGQNNLFKMKSTPILVTLDGAGGIGGLLARSQGWGWGSGGGEAEVSKGLMTLTGSEACYGWSFPLAADNLTTDRAGSLYNGLCELHGQLSA